MRAYVEAIHYFKTRKEETIQILRKYSRVEDRTVLEHTQSWFTQNMPSIPIRRSRDTKAWCRRWQQLNPRRQRSIQRT